MTSTTATTTVVEVQSLTKQFGPVTAIDDISFSIEENKIYGLLGRNGAGKTTIMSLLSGQDFVTQGHVRVFGGEPAENARVLRNISFIKESQKYPDDFKPKHVFTSAPWFLDRKSVV